VDLPEVDVLLSIVAHKSGISPSAYMRKRTRRDFESDVSGWVSSFIYPVNQIAKSFLGDGSSSVAVQTSTQKGTDPQDVDQDQLQRERRSSRLYSWKRKVSGRRYNLVNLDVANQDAYKQAVSTMKSEFSKQ
jgi:hypothetical protein